jgi:hypothetical protein
MDKDFLREQFWIYHRSIKRKTTAAGELAAKKELLQFCWRELREKSEEDLNEIFGEEWSNYVKRWINAEIVTNRFGRHLYVKLGSVEN